MELMDKFGKIGQREISVIGYYSAIPVWTQRITEKTQR